MENQQESSTQAMSHKGEQRNKYTMEFKRKVINYAKENSYNGAARKFKIDRKRVREWVNQEDKVLKMKGKRFRVEGGGRKLTDNELEDEVLNWIHRQRENILRVSRELMFKAKAIFNEKCGDDEALKESFFASNGWLVKVIKRKHLSLRRRTTIAQKDPSHLVSLLDM